MAKIKKLKKLGTLFVVGFAGFWVFSGLYSYFTHAAAPEFLFSGIENGQFYAGDIKCKIQADSSYKIAHINTLLDGALFNAIPGGTSVRSAVFERSFVVNTSNLTQGEHIFTIEAVDTSYKKNKSTITRTFMVDNRPLKASFVHPAYKVDQGRTIHVQVKSSKPVEQMELSFLSEVYSCFPESKDSSMYECYLPIDCELHPGEHPVQVAMRDSAQNALTIQSTVQVCECDFPKQKGFSVSSKKMDSERDSGLNQKMLEQALEASLAQTGNKKQWMGRFEMPTHVQRISTPYGEIRTTQEKGRYYHRAVDLVNMPKSVVWASQAGKLIIKERYVFTGNTVAIDHGRGVVTVYAHLDGFADAQVGDFVKKGEPIGTLGKTGYAAGYHLHWELRVQNKLVDPLEWTSKIF